MSAYQEFRTKFPDTKRATDSVFKEGLALYKAGDYGQAAHIFGLVQPSAPPNPEGARNSFWKGKALEAAGDKVAAQQAFVLAAQQGPGSYYAFQAEALQQSSNSVPASAGIPLRNTAITADDEAEALGWLNKSVPGVNDLAAAEARRRVSEDEHVQRGNLLYEMGQWDGATEEYRAAVRSYQSDAPSLYALARLLHDRGQHAVAMLAVYYLQDLTSTQTAVDLPRLLLKIIYPTPYQSQVEEAAKQYAVDPLLMYSLMRQESSFNPQATSSAQAIGLTQVMPNTGKGIATDLRVEHFETNDLYRPIVSIRFGSYYLSRQLAFLGQNPVFALSAYNGGAGSVLRWMGNNRQIDPDLFVENIDYEETQLYARIVIENYAYYKLLYR